MGRISDCTPSFTVSPKAINLMMEIAEMVNGDERVSIIPDWTLRKQLRIISIQSSLQIEANSLSVEDVTDIINGVRVLGPPRDILEVKDAYSAYELLSELDPFKTDDLLRAHGVMMSGLVKEAGAFRTVGVNVVNSRTGEVIHHAPDPELVPDLIKNLIKWASASEYHPLIVGCVFHHEFEFIHPFRDGNGRMGRMWQTLILSKWMPVFEWLPVESMIRDRQMEYYRAIQEADQGDTSSFIDFMLEAIRDALKKWGKNKSSVRMKVLELIKSGEYTNSVEIAQLLNVSTSTIERVIYSLRNDNLIIRKGSKKTGYWVFVGSIDDEQD